MKHYMVKDTGVIFTEDEVKELWEQFGHEPKFDTYEDMIGAMIEIDDYDQLVADISQFEYDFDPYVYGDAVGDLENGRVMLAEALQDPNYRQVEIDRLTEIAEEFDDIRDRALDLIARLKEYD